MHLPASVSLCLLLVASLGLPAPVAADIPHERAAAAAHRRVAAGSGRTALDATRTKATRSIEPRAEGDIVFGGVTWQSQGCLIDGSPRLLSGSYTSLKTTNTPAACIAACAAGGFSYAGVQNGDQCYCGSTLNASGKIGTTAADSYCQAAACPGDASQKCGGPFYMRVWQATTGADTPLPSGWSSQGCVIDGSPRLLTGSYTSLRTTNTPATCIAACAAGGFSYAGLENGDQCYCGSTLNASGRIGTTAADSYCQAAACPGDTKQACGGPFYLRLFKFTPSTSVALPLGWQSQGCVIDSSTARVLTGSSPKLGDKNTPQACIAACVASGFGYAGVEYGNECYCGSSPHVAGNIGTTVSDSVCQAMPCSGDPSQACGTGGRMRLFRLVPSASAALPSGWQSKGCVVDSSTARVLTGSSPRLGDKNTPQACITACVAGGFSFAGVEYGSECYCGSTLNAAGSVGSTVADSACQAMSCSGDLTQACGDGGRMILYQLMASQPTQTTGPGGCPAGGSFVPALAAPASNSRIKSVFSHHMVGNTLPYTQATWLNDITMARDQGGIDAFALNLGPDTLYQPKQIASAYAAAAQAGSFKLFLSFDMAVFNCGDIMGSMLNYVKTYGKHGSQYTYKSAILVSTFAGESCGDGAWQNFKTTLAAQGYPIYFVPGFFDSQDWSSWSSVDGILGWNSAWSMDANDITTALDASYLARLKGKSYMPAVSPLFFTHYAPNSYNKNWIYQSDSWQYAIRWEQIIAMRDKTDFVEQVTWNDYGESHYIGPIAGDQPNSEAWVNGFDHSAFLAVNKYYSAAFKTGKYPTISCDVVYLMARPHDNRAVGTNDPAGPPTLGQYGAPGSQYAETNDFFALIFSTAPATVTMTSGSSTKTYTVPGGISRLEAPLQTGAGMTVKLVRGRQTYINFTPSGFTFAATTQINNFNYYVYASNA